MKQIYKKLMLILNSRFIEFILLVFILVAGFSIRLYRVHNPVADWHSWRQADTASVTRNYIQNGIDLLKPRFDDISSIQSGISNPNGYRMVEFPIYNAISALVTSYLGHFSVEVWSRIVTISSAVISAYFLYLIGKRFLGKWGGLLTAFFYLYIPYNIYFTRVILPDPIGVTFGVISLWLFIRFFDDKGDIYIYLSGLFFALMLLIKPYMGVYLIPIIYLVVKKYGFKEIFKNKKIWYKAAIFIGISILPFILWRTWEAKFPEGIPFYKWAFNGNNIRFKPSWWYWIFGERLGHLILGSLGMVPFIFGVLNTKTKNHFIQWFLFSAVVYVVVVADANVMHDYYQIQTIPVIALTLAAGTVYLLEQNIFNKWFTKIILAGSVGIMFITGWNQIVGDYNVNHPEILEAGREIQRITPKDAIVVAPYNGDTAFLYATDRRGWPAIDDSIENIIGKGAGYYVSVNLDDKDTKDIEAKYKTIEKTKTFIIINLRESIPVKKK